MKSLGIIRRVDDLGRVVIPKEIRKIFNIREGDPLEVFASEDMICLRKHMYKNSYINTIKNVIDGLSEEYELNNSTKNLINEKLKDVIELLDVHQ